MSTKYRYIAFVLGMSLLINFGLITNSKASSISAGSPASQCKIPNLDQNTNYRIGWPTSSSTLPSIGSPRILILPIDFPDAPSNFESGSNSQTQSQLQSMSNYFARTSHGAFKPIFEIYRQVIRMPLDSSTYGNSKTDDVKIKNEYGDHLIIKTALGLVQDKVKVSEYSAVISIITGGKSLSGYVGLASSRNPPDIVTTSGEIHNYIVIGDGVLTSKLLPAWKTFVHEMEHLLGLPDLYLYAPDSDYLGKSTGAFGMLSSIQYNSVDALSWNLWKLGWIKDSQIYCFTSETRIRNFQILPFQFEQANHEIIMFKLSSRKILVIQAVEDGLGETRTEAGILVYEVDSAIPTGYGPITIIPKQTPVTTAPISPVLKDWDRFSNAALAPGEFVSVEGFLIRNNGDPAASDEDETFYSLSVDYGVEATKILGELTQNGKTLLPSQGHRDDFPETAATSRTPTLMCFKGKLSIKLFSKTAKCPSGWTAVPLKH